MAYLNLVPETLDNKRRFLPTGILDWTSDVCLSGREIYAGGEFRLMPFIVGQVDERGLPRGERIPGTNPSRSRVNCLMVVSSCARGRLRAGAQLLGRPRHDPIEIRWPRVWPRYTLASRFLVRARAAPRPAVSIRRRRPGAMGTVRREPIETAGRGVGLSR